MENKKILSKIKLRKHLDADSLFKAVYSDFEKFPDIRFGNISISLSDALMSGFAIFSLKEPSLLAFDNRLQDKSILKNIESVYGICNVPDDSRMREILDNVNPAYFKSPFKTVFREIQRGGALNPMKYIEGHYLSSLAGTGFFSSGKLGSDKCLVKKNKKTGETIGYYQQLLGAVTVHPENFGRCQKKG
jgi:hypothetical protein